MKWRGYIPGKYIVTYWEWLAIQSIKLAWKELSYLVCIRVGGKWCRMESIILWSLPGHEKYIVSGLVENMVSFN